MYVEWKIAGEFSATIQHRLCQACAKRKAIAIYDLRLEKQMLLLQRFAGAVSEIRRTVVVVCCSA